MKNNILILTCTLIPLLSFGSAKSDPIKSQLRLDQETFVTDKNGVANPNIIINLIPGQNIRIYLPNGKFFTGIVKSTEMVDDRQFKVFGELHGEEEIGFGFCMIKGGIFAGAICYKNTLETYTLEFSKESAGYVFQKKFTNKIGTI
jgi:hypothetical protein